MINITGLDEKDNKILNIIENNARLTYSEIGKQAGLSRVAVKNRMDALEERGIICGYRTLINQKAVNNTGVRFVLVLEVFHDRFEDVLEMLSGEELIREVNIMSGTDRIMAEGISLSSQGIRQLIDKLYRNPESFKTISCHTILSTVKDDAAGIRYERMEEDINRK